MSHFVNVCMHGDVRGQCRCPAKDKAKILVECPSSHKDTDKPVVFVGATGRQAVPVARVDETAPIPYTGKGNQFQVNTDPIGSDDHDALVALIKRISPIKHEPLATAVAEDWAREFEKNGWVRRGKTDEQTEGSGS